MLISIISITLSVFLANIQLVCGNKNLNSAMLTSGLWYVVGYEGPIIPTSTFDCMTVKITERLINSIDAEISYTSSGITSKAWLRATHKTSDVYAIELDATMNYNTDTEDHLLMEGILRLRFFTSEVMYWSLENDGTRSNFILSRHRSLSSEEETLKVVTDSSMTIIANSKGPFCPAEDATRPGTDVDVYGIAGTWYVVEFVDDLDRLLPLKSWEITITKSGTSPYEGHSVYTDSKTEAKSEHNFNVVWDHNGDSSEPIYKISTTGGFPATYYATKLDSYFHDFTYWKLYNDPNLTSTFIGVFLSSNSILSEEDRLAIESRFSSRYLKRVTIRPETVSTELPAYDEITESVTELSKDNPESTTVVESTEDGDDDDDDDDAAPAADIDDDSLEDESAEIPPSKASGPSYSFLLFPLLLFYSYL